MKQLLALFLISGLMAQEHDWDEKEHDGRDHDRSERMESMMVWRLTDDLELSPEQAEKFFPRFRSTGERWMTFASRKELSVMK